MPVGEHVDMSVGEALSVEVYEAESPDAIRAHAEAAELPVDKIVPISETVVVRLDPPVTPEGG